MRKQDLEWVDRAHDLVPWLWVRAYPPRGVQARACFVAWRCVIKAHRWLWFRGVRL